MLSRGAVDSTLSSVGRGVAAGTSRLSSGRHSASSAGVASACFASPSAASIGEEGAATGTEAEAGTCFTLTFTKRSDSNSKGEEA